MAGEPILVVDDNAQNAKLARVLLTSAGYDIRVAVDAAEALRVLETFTPRLIRCGASRASAILLTMRKPAPGVTRLSAADETRGP